MIGIQIGMAEAGAVQASQGNTQADSDPPAPARIFFREEDSPQLHSRHFAHQEESSTLPILARGQPLRCADAFTLESL